MYGEALLRGCFTYIPAPKKRLIKKFKLNLIPTLLIYLSKKSSKEVAMRKVLVLTMLAFTASSSFSEPMERLISIDTPYNEDYTVKIGLLDSSVNWSFLIADMQMSTKIIPWFFGFQNIGFKVGVKVPLTGLKVGANLRWLSLNPYFIKDQVETSNISVDFNVGWTKFSILAGYEIDDETTVYAAFEFTKAKWSSSLFTRPVIGVSYYLGGIVAVFGEVGFCSGIEYTTPPENETWLLYNYMTSKITAGGGIHLTFGPVMIRGGVLYPGFKVYIPTDSGTEQVSLPVFPYADVAFRF